MTRAEVADMIASVEKRRGLRPGTVIGVRRDARAASARQECYLRLRVAGLSYPEIGRAMRRDHSTVIYGVGRFKAVEPTLSEAIRLTSAAFGPRLWQVAIELAAKRRAAELKAGIVERQGWAYSAEGRAF